MEQDIIKHIENIISQPVADEKDIIRQLKKVIREAEVQVSQEKIPKSGLELCTESIRMIENQPNSDFLSTGFENFDTEFGGLSTGEFVVIGGRPSMGKTQMLVTLALHISLTHPVLYYTLDLSETFLSYRFISGITGVSGTSLLQRTLSDDEKTKLLSVEFEMQKRDLLVMGGGNINFHAFKEHCLREIAEKGIKVIIVDYLQLINTGRSYKSRESEIGEITREFKTICRDSNVCVIASSQLSRSVETRSSQRKPILSDLRESGAIEQDADKVLFIYRPEYYEIEFDENGNSTDCVIELIVAKNRNGVTGSVNLLRGKQFTTIYSDPTHFKQFTFSEERLKEFEVPF